MRKHFLGLAVISLLLVATSCNKETSETFRSQENQISFRSALGKQTKATEFTNSSWVDNDNFIVYSYTGNTVTRYDEFTLTYNAGTWAYETSGNQTSIDQPGFSLTYNTWFPQDASAVYSDAVYPATLAYTVPATAAQQKDLIATTNTTTSADVTLAFDHLLSQVNFAVQEVENVKISLVNIHINKVFTKGTYTFGSGWGTTANTQLAEANPYVYTPVTDPFQTTGTTTNPIFYLGNKGGNTQTDNNNSNALMLMPQTFATSDNGTITFDYVLTDMGDTPSMIGSGSATANLCDFDVTEWVAGRRYLYLIDFTNYFKSGKITFTVSVNPWRDADEYMEATTLEVSQANASSIEGAIATHNAAKGNTNTLTVFPISLPAATALTADVVLTLDATNSGIFAAGDVIKIQCNTAANAGFIKLATNANWTLATSGSVVTLTRN